MDFHTAKYAVLNTLLWKLMIKLRIGQQDRKLI